MRVLPFAAPVFLGAFLLFLVQPLIARYILPWFGGAAGVWSVAMLFFQVVLLAGYGYAHLLTTRAGPRVQAAVHCAVLAACAALLPIEPSAALKPAPDAEPTLGILLLLAATVGAPYFALSATGPLLQAWFARAMPGRSPYPLYALSNVGSLLALLAYPFGVEPIWGRSEQATWWSWGFGGFAVLCALAAVLSGRAGGSVAAGTGKEPAPARRVVAMWIALPAVASALLLSCTHELCIDVASVPFLWVLPLALYLVSFIVTFAGSRPLPRGVWFPLAAIAIAGTTVAMGNRLELSLPGAVIVHSLCLLALCLVLHSEAFRLRPGASRLTQFYLCVSAGGALGGFFVAVVAPLVFPAHLELGFSLVACALLLAWQLWTDAKGPLYRGGYRPVWGLIAAAVAGLVFALAWNFRADHEHSVLLARNFYGTYVVSEPPQGSGESWYRTLSSGTTQHGSQFMDPQSRDWPTTYYARQSGVGLVWNLLPPGPRRVGIVGLGVGTLAAYGRKGDQLHFYEINPRCVDIANRYFFFLKDCPASCEFVLGDARLSLDQRPDQAYDLLALDAFTSDSIPVHLLTLEALELYLRHLAPDAPLCVHISNRHLDLAPVLRGAADALGLHVFGVDSRGDGSGANSASWIILTRDPALQQRLESALLTGPAVQMGTRLVDMGGGRRTRLWTDDYSNLFDVLR